MLQPKWIGANSKNYGVGRQGKQVSMIVVHWIVGRLSAADATFQDANREASAHYGVSPKEIHQYVKESDTAYHAGNLAVNLVSIGIEHEGGPDIPIDENTYKNSAELIASLAKKYNIPLNRDHVKMHKEVKIGATSCPGTLNIDKLLSMAIIINLPNVNGGSALNMNDSEFKTAYLALIKTLHNDEFPSGSNADLQRAWVQDKSQKTVTKYNDYKQRAENPPVQQPTQTITRAGDALHLAGDLLNAGKI